MPTGERPRFFLLELFFERDGAHFLFARTKRSMRACLSSCLGAMRIEQMGDGGETRREKESNRRVTNDNRRLHLATLTFSLSLSLSHTLSLSLAHLISLPKTPNRSQTTNRLYVETVDLGDPEPRTIVSGLVKFVPIDQMRDRLVVALCNLKPRNMRGVKSDGMLLCASDAAHENVEPLDPPAGASPGDRIGFELDGARPGEQPAPAGANQVQKKKIWEALQPELRVLDSRVASWKGSEMVAAAGKVTAASLVGGGIS